MMMMMQHSDREFSEERRLGGGGEIRAPRPLRTIHLHSRTVQLLRAGTEHCGAGTVVDAEIEIYVDV